MARLSRTCPHLFHVVIVSKPSPLDLYQTDKFSKAQKSGFLQCGSADSQMIMNQDYSVDMVDNILLTFCCRAGKIH